MIKTTSYPPCMVFCARRAQNTIHKEVKYHAAAGYTHFPKALNIKGINMIDPRMEKLADILVNYCAAVRPGDWVRVQADVLALPLVQAVQRLILQAGGHPNVHLSADELEESFLREASQEQLAWVAPTEPLINEQIAASIRIAASSNTRALTSIDPGKPRLFQNARSHLRRDYMQRAAAGK